MRWPIARMVPMSPLRWSKSASSGTHARWLGAWHGRSLRLLATTSVTVTFPPLSPMRSNLPTISRAGSPSSRKSANFRLEEPALIVRMKRSFMRLRWRAASAASPLPLRENADAVTVRWPGPPRSTGVNRHDLVQQLQRLLPLSLEGISADNRPETAALTNRRDFLEYTLVGLRRTAREDHDATAVEGALHNVAHAIGEGADRDVFFLVHLAGRLLFQVVGRQLDLDNMRAELGGKVD